MADDIRIIKGFRVKRHPNGRLETLGPAETGPQPVTVGTPRATAQFDVPQAAANVDKTQTDITKTQTDIVDTREDNRRDDVRLVAELYKQGLRPDGNGGVEPIPNWVPPAGSDVGKDDRLDKNKLSQFRTLEAQLARVEELYRAGPGTTSGVWGIMDRFPTAANEAFDTAAAGLADVGKAAFRVPGSGDQNAQEVEQFIAANMPRASDNDAKIEEKIRNLRTRLETTYETLGVKPERDEQGLPNALTYLRTDGGRNNEAVGPARIPGFSPSGGPSLEQSADETYSTPEDLAVAKAVQQVYNNGGTVRDMAEAARGLGYPANLQNMQEWARAIDYRDAKGEYEGQRTGYSTVTPPQSGKRSLVGQMFGDFARDGIGSMAVGAGIGAAKAATFGGIDEITGGINSVIRGTDAGDEIAYANIGKQAAFDNAPGSAIFGEIAGSVGLGGLTAKAFPNALETLAGSGRRALGTGAVLGGVTGALEANENRVGGAIGGTVLGGVGGLFGRKLIGPGIEAVASSAPAQALSQKARSFVNTIRPGTAAPSALPILPTGQRAAAGAMGDEIGDVRTRLNEAEGLGLPYSLADASPKLRSLAGSVARKSQDARQMAEETFDPRYRDQAFRARQAIGTNLAEPFDDPKIRGDELLAGGSRAAEPYYTMANNRAAPIDEELQAFLNTDTGRDAMKAARRIAENRGEDPDALGFTVNDYGDVVLGTYPNFKTLDLIKQGIDAQIYNPANTNPVTGELNKMSPEVKSLERYRQNFVKTLDRLNPAYPKARAEYANFARAKEALELGLKGPSGRVAPRDIERITGGMADQSLEEYRGGFATGLADMVDGAKLSGNPYERIYGGTSQRQKIETLFPEGADQFRRTYDLERDMAQTRYETLGGSPTAARMAADDQFGEKAMEMAGDFAADLTATGGALTAGNLLKAGARGVKDMSRLGMGKQAEKRADALAPILYNTDPAKAGASLDEIERYLKARDLRKDAFRRRGGLFGATAPIVLFPSE